MSSYGQPTLWEKVGYIPMICNALVAGIWALVTGPLRDPAKTPPTLYKHVAYSMLRAGLGGSSVPKLQYLLPQTTEGYTSLAKQKGFAPRTLTHSATNVKSHYIGSPDAETVMLYFHGGGYVMPASPAHLEWLYSVVQALNQPSNDRGKNSFAVLVLAYTLAPDAIYPTPLAQATECLNDLLKGRNPDSVIIAGDSAGANLCLSLLSHMLHPHPSSAVPRLAALSAPLKGALLISPWVEIDGKHRASMTANIQSDVSSPKALASWRPLFLGTGKSDNYVEAVRAGAEWWQGLEKVVGNVLVWGGGGEVLIDGIKVVMRDMEKAYPSGVEAVVGFNMCHEQMVIDTMLGCGKGESAEVVQSWLSARL